MRYLIWHNMFPDWGIRMLYMSWHLLEPDFWANVDKLKLVEKE